MHLIIFIVSLAVGGLLGSMAVATDVSARPGEHARAHHRPSGHGMSGLASIYGGRERGGSRTATGERVRVSGLTAAHRSLPFGTMVQVTNRRNGRTVVVRINDRGPFVRGRVIDVTPAAARALGFSGLTAVSLAVVSGR